MGKLPKSMFLSQNILEIVPKFPSSKPYWGLPTYGLMHRLDVFLRQFDASRPVLSRYYFHDFIVFMVLTNLRFGAACPRKSPEHELTRVGEEKSSFILDASS
ncbi:uncharacterized protein RBU33_025701 isoform 1-T2 [Hipposideros larvatus]